MVKAEEDQEGSKMSELDRTTKINRKSVEFLKKKSEILSSSSNIANPPSALHGWRAKLEESEEINGEKVAEGPAGSGGRKAIITRHRSSSDKSVAGGGVIIGGLVTAVFASVYCYIRATRRRVGEQNQ